MDKKQETMPRDKKSDGDVFTGIHTVGVLTPNLDKLLGVNDIVMLIVIDTKNQKHLRINYPQEIKPIRINDAPEIQPPGINYPQEIIALLCGGECGIDHPSNCFWKKTCEEPVGEPRHMVKQYLIIKEGCPYNHDPEDLEPC